MKNNKKPAKSISLHTSTTTFSIHNSVLHTQSDFLFRSVLISNRFDFCLAIFNFLCLLFGQHLHLFVVLIASCPTFFAKKQQLLHLYKCEYYLLRRMRKIHDRTSTNFNLSYSLARSFMVAAAAVCILAVSVGLFVCVCCFLFSSSLARSRVLDAMKKNRETWNERQHRHTISQYEDSNLIRALCGSIVTFKFAIVRTHGHTHSQQILVSPRN